MFGLETVAAVLAKHGLVVLAPIAVLEGPIVTVIAAWLASQGLFSLWSVALVVILADLVGDFLLYSIGRWGLNGVPDRWLGRLGLNRPRLDRLAAHFEEKGGRTLLFGKLTHSAGAAVLVAAGLARMPAFRFGWVNLAATVPKSLVFVALGYGFGSAYARIDNWISRVSLVLLAIIVVGGAAWLFYRIGKR
ncbi:DedA family protein [Sinisalibacter aestuarii]|uniref:Membrane protein n=1 Tax=Sinisalibacter aestuarii TaxID=2949426 RepID=A0ABQ5LR26_9RHOB|nr:VTT domain-containing protein [Sinisalibacter aestuarii]GKY86527.1 membrane protein [Sinisalibacter aestuarii]